MAKETQTPQAENETRSYTKKVKIGKESVGDTINFTTDDNVMHSGVITDLSVGDKLINGQKASTRKMLVRYNDNEGEKYAMIEQTCIAPEGSKIDWSTLYCLQPNYSTQPIG